VQGEYEEEKMNIKDRYGHEIPFNEVLSKAAVVQLLEHLKCTQFAPPFAHLDAHNALNAALKDILDTEGAKLNAAEEAKNRAIAENLIEEANLKKSRSRRNINAMSEKLMVMVAQTLKEEYHWSNCRIDHFFDKFERIVMSYNDNVPRSAKQNEEHAIAMAKAFERKYDFAIDPMFEEARRYLDGEEISDEDN
jgi:hypothetical protein